MNQIGEAQLRMGCTMTLYIATRVSAEERPSSTQQGHHNVEGFLGSLDTVTSVKAEGEVEIQCGLIIDSHLWL